MKFTAFAFLTCLMCAHTSLAQTGPGGVSSGTGTLRLWLDGRRINSNGTNPTAGTEVVTWYDKSGNGVNVTRSANGVATAAANGVTFNGTGYLAGSDAGFPTGNAARTVFICASSASTDADDVLFFYGSSNANQAYGILKLMSSNGTAPNGVRNYFYNNDLDVANGFLPSGTVRIVTATYTNNTQSVYLHGAAPTTRTPTTPATVLGGTQGLQIGGWNTFSLFSQATINEVIFHNALLDGADINIINNYLAAKYGLTLAANELYDNDISGNGNFDYDVAGIGQIASGSNVDAQSSIMRIYSPSGLGNNEYFLWGHDNATLLPTTSGIPPAATGIQARLTRIWRGSETGDITSATISFDLTGMGPVTTSDLRLLIDVDNDGLFTDETTMTGGIIGSASASGNVYSFASVPLRDDSRFTLATINSSRTPLPVTLVSFDATQQNNQMLLTWKTASEINSDYFAIEHSIDGQVWIPLDSIDAAGNSAQLKTYTYHHTTPLNGLNYYRLKQVDLDESSEYSYVISANISYGDAAFPNPTSGAINITFKDEPPALSSIHVFDSQGKNLDHRVSIERLSNGHYQIDLSLLAEAVYIVKTDRSQILVQKK